MFDPLFILGILSGPIALLLLLRRNVERQTGNVRVRLASAFLALVAVWGMGCWGVVFYIEIIGGGMSEKEFSRVIVASFLVSAAFVAVGYWLAGRQNNA